MKRFNSVNLDQPTLFKITITILQSFGFPQTFYGNYDRTTVVRRLLYHGVITRYFRIVLKTYQGGTPCLRTEIYGYLFQPACSSHSVGIPSSSLVPHHRFTATSEEGHNCCNPYKGRLGAIPGWLPKTDTAPDYLQVDLGDVFYICAVATQGHGGSYDEWVTRYKVLYSTNNKAWTTYSDESGNEHEFNGNSDKTTVVTNPITNPFRAKFVRVFPTAYHNRKMIRIDFKGLPSGCSSSLGLENSQISDLQMTSSSSSDSSHTASRGRLYGSSSWCSSTTSNTEYIQVDLEQTKTVTGIATQGGNSLNKWVTSYKVSYSFDNRDWNEYNDGQVVKVFSGNSNKNDVIVNWFNRPIAARYLRILPQTSSGGAGHCLRLDLYGCVVFVIPKVILDTAQVILPAIKGTSTTLSCSVLGEPTPDIQWFNNGTKINGATQPTLQVQFISAEDVLSKYSCPRQDPRTRAVVCNTFYTCRIVNPVHLPSGGINEATVKMVVNLNVPEAPNLTASPDKRSITLRWIAMTGHNDVGHIISYTIEFNNESTVVTLRVQHPAVNYSLEHLKPYTSYSIRMNAISSVGQGLWSSWMNVITFISEPDGIPFITMTSAISSQTIKIHFKYEQSYVLNGPMAGFRVYFTPEGGSQQHTDVGNVTMTKLTNLRKYTNYTISVSVRNTMYAGPPSSTKQITTLQDVPDIGPQNIRATKINDTTFLVTWQPLTTHQSNGVVTKYEINWSFLVGRSRRSLQEIATATTQGTQYTMYNLKPCAKYTVHVRGYTRIGPGPNSTVKFVTTHRCTTEYTNSTIWALQGDELTIGCFTSGDEPITYIWTKNGYLIVDSSVAKARGSELIISLGSDKDFGTYVCTATNSERTVVYRINKVELKKYSTSKFNGNTVVPYVIPLALIILLLIICIFYLLYRLRKDKKHYQERIDKKMDDITNEKQIQNDDINQSRYPDDVIQFQRRQPTKPDPAKANKIEHPTYMELKPTQDNNSIYQSIQEPLKKTRNTTSPQTQGTTGHGEYMDLKPRENTGYETLHHQKAVPDKDYETVNRGFYKNVSIDDTEV